MKFYQKLTLVVAFFMVAVGASIAGGQAMAEDDQCLYVYSVAEDIMHQRQHDIALPEMLNKFKDDKGRIALVKEAFTYNLMNLEENKVSTAKKFAEWSYNQCEKN